MRGDLAGWAARRAPELIARAEAEAVAELKAALIAAATDGAPAPPAPPRAPERAPAPARREPSPVEGTGVWAYCVARGTPAADGPGVDPAGETRWITEGELSLLCSVVPMEEFAEDSLRRNLNEMPWLERVARAHEAAIARALDGATIVPLRLCTIFAGEPQARAMLTERAGELSAALDRLDGKVEWSVKLLIDREKLEAAAREEPGAGGAEPGSGAAYMLLRREERRAAEAVSRAANGLAEYVHARLQDWAADARVRPAQNRELSGHTGDMVLNGAYLVDRTKSEELRELVARLQERHSDVGARLELGGPYPPYSFVPETA